MMRETTIIDRLATRGPVDQGPEVACEPHELVGHVGQYDEVGNDAGFDRVTVHLVRSLVDGRLRLLVARDRVPEEGYSASGTEEVLLDLPEVVQQGLAQCAGRVE